MNAPHTFNRHLYWIDDNDFSTVKSQLRDAGYRLAAALKTPCEVLNATGNKLYYARPAVWSRLCVRQGSWYRESDRAGKTMLMSKERLPGFMDAYLDATLRDSDFSPDTLPGAGELQELVESDTYRQQRPDEWEQTGIKDSLMFKAFFTVTGFWGRGDNLRKHWLTHRANHANFLARQFTTRLDDEDVPYSISENSGVCSSCVEFFNVTVPESRKLVRACPGSISFSSVERDHYYDVQPVQIPVTHLTAH
ncbi:MAG: hypothetical protein PVF75_03785 [Granulosicoccaceae bacterium]